MKHAPRVRICIVACILLLVGVPLRSDMTALPSFDLVKQTQSSWCWAACTEMITEYYGSRLPQCTVANKYLTLEKCCHRSVPKSCNVGGLLAEVLSRNGFTSPVEPHSYVWTTGSSTSSSSPTPTPDFTALSEEIMYGAISSVATTSGRPVGCVWNWGGTGSHIMVVTGVGTLTDVTTGVATNYVIVNDPAGLGNVWTLTHSYYVKSDESMAHTLSVEYHDIMDPSP